MLQLPNNCRAGKFSYFPKNWNTSKASIKIKWRITYWFYDDNVGTRKKVKLQGMNRALTLLERQAAVKLIVEDELEILQGGTNHITLRSNEAPSPVPIEEVKPKKKDEDLSLDDLNEKTGFADALQIAFNTINLRKETKDDIKSCLKYFKQALAISKIDEHPLTILPISEVQKKHTNLVMKKLEVVKKDKWTANNFNHYRKYISILFGELLEAEVIEYNPIKLLKKKGTIKKVRATLTQKERKKIDEYLVKKDYFRWRFMHIFFHSGSRESEMLRIQKQHVDLENQRYLVTILKGRSATEKWRPIKDIVLPLWKEVFLATPHKNYLFAKFLKPGAEPIRAKQISRWWKKNIKDELKIQADFYSLKHSNTTEIMDHLSDLKEISKQAAAMNAHTTEAMVVNIYDTKHEERKHNIVKKVNNPFV